MSEPLNLTHDEAYTLLRVLEYAINPEIEMMYFEPGTLQALQAKVLALHRNLTSGLEAMTREPPQWCALCKQTHPHPAADWCQSRGR